MGTLVVALWGSPAIFDSVSLHTVASTNGLVERQKGDRMGANKELVMVDPLRLLPSILKRYKKLPANSLNSKVSPFSISMIARKVSAEGEEG